MAALYLARWAFAPVLTQLTLHDAARATVFLVDHATLLILLHRVKGKACLAAARPAPQHEAQQELPIKSHDLVEHEL